MAYIVVVTVDTWQTPQHIIREIVSTLEFELTTHTTVHAVVVLGDNGSEQTVYTRDQQNANGG